MTCPNLGCELSNVPDFEVRRLDLQAERDSAKTQRERNRLGQFATPTSLAMDILRYGVSLLPDTDKVRFLDPAIGTGSFYSAFRRTVPSDRIAGASGYEIDPHYGMAAVKLWADTELQYHLEDFTKATSPKEGFNLLICNPPYVRHHHLSAEEKKRLQQLSMRICGHPIRGLAGLYCYFMGISHAWMAENGIAGWLIPSEFMDVNYGKTVKQYLLQDVTLLRFHRFDPNDVQFSDALVSSAVVWIKKTKPSPDHKVTFTFGGTLDKPVVSLKISREELKSEPKWTRFPLAEVRTATSGPKIADFFQIKRGLATGSNSFFILTREDIDRKRLPWQFFRPILPSPRYLKVSEIPADEAGIPKLDRELFLLDCNLPEDVIEANFPTLWEYLQSGCPDVSERYLCQHRSPCTRRKTVPDLPSSVPTWAVETRKSRSDSFLTTRKRQQQMSI